MRNVCSWSFWEIRAPLVKVARLLVEAARVPHLLTFCMISLNTLARPDAVLDLSPSQVDIHRRLIKLNPEGGRQTKKYRPVVPISETLLPWLLKYSGPRYVLYHGKPVASEAKGFMGHKNDTARTTERYARFRPDHLGQAVKAIDAYFTDLKSAVGGASDVIFNPVRASSV